MISGVQIHGTVSIGSPGYSVSRYSTSSFSVKISASQMPLRPSILLPSGLTLYAVDSKSLNRLGFLLYHTERDANADLSDGLKKNDNSMTRSNFSTLFCFSASPKNIRLGESSLSPSTSSHQSTPSCLCKKVTSAFIALNTVANENVAFP